MKKTLLTFALACLFLVFFAGSSSNPVDVRLGYVAPNFVIENGNNTMELQQKKGRYVLLAFWTSTDAESRIANVVYDRSVRNLEGVDYVAVNFDRSYGVYNEMVKIDGLDNTKQFYDCNGIESKVYFRYGLKNGMKTLLLDKSGRVIAENPTLNELKRLLE